MASRGKMGTYGKKKKRSFLGLSSLFRDTKSEARDNSKKEDSLVQLPEDPESRVEAARDDSVDKMASELLDTTEDTMDDIRPTAGRHLSEVPRSMTMPNIAQYNQSYQNKLLPKLPELTYNGDDVWASRNSPVVTAEGHANATFFDGDSPPGIPRKSSKRQSVRPNLNNSKVKPGSSRKQDLKISHPSNLENLGEETKMLSSTTPEKYIKEQLDAATRTLKGPAHSQSIHGAHKVIRGGREQKLFRAPLKALSKMKSVTNLFQAGISSSHRGPSRNERLLDQSINELHELDEGSTMEIGCGEGKNLVKSEVPKSTGYVGIRRKPAPGYGNFLKNATNQQLGEDMFNEALHSSGLAVAPTSPENQLEDGMDLGEHEGHVPEWRLLIRTPRAEYRMPRKLSYAGEFDDVLSSSPQDQSTPRLRREPSFEDNTKNERKVNAGTRSLFGSQPGFSYSQPSFHMDIDDEQIGLTVSEDRLKRKETQDVLSPAKRTKKHPSPPREYLHEWGIHVEQNLQKWEMDAKSSSGNEEDEDAEGDEDDGDVPFAKFTSLSTKDASETMKTANGHAQGREAFSNDVETGKAGATSAIGPNKLKSTMRKQAIETRRNLINGSHINGDNVTDGSMDIDQDELQWTKKEYDIQLRKFGSDEDKTGK